MTDKAPFDRIKARFWSKVNKTDSCWLWESAINHHGYGLFSIHYKTRRAHRLSWEWANGEIPKGLFVLHECDVRGCVNPDHLFLGTPKDNTKDMYEKGRANSFPGDRRGESSPTSKLTNDSVLAIRALAGSISTQAIANQFGVSKSTVQAITCRRLWKHL